MTDSLIVNIKDDKMKKPPFGGFTIFGLPTVQYHSVVMRDRFLSTVDWPIPFTAVNSSAE